MSDRTKGFTDWTDVAKTVMQGKKIVDVGYIGKDEAANYMWNSRGVYFILDEIRDAEYEDI